MAKNPKLSFPINLRGVQRPRPKYIPPLAGSDREPLKAPPSPQLPPPNTRPPLVIAWVPEHKPLSRDPRAQFDRVFGTEHKPKQPTDPRRAFHGLFGDTEVPEEKVRTIDDEFPVGMPFCPHKVRLNKNEYIFETSYKGRPYCRKMNGRIVFASPKSFECIRCHPVCVHGLELTKAEIKTGVRYSAKCPGCTKKITDRRVLEQFFSTQRLALGEGMSLLEGAFQTSYGLWITKPGKRFQVSGGSKKMEQLDAAHVAITDDGPAGNGREGGVIAVFTGDKRSKLGWGPDTNRDDDFKNWPVDGAGDPGTIGPSEVVSAFEYASAETKDETTEESDEAKAIHEDYPEDPEHE